LRLQSFGSTPTTPAIDIYDATNATEFVLSPSADKVDLFTYSTHALALGTANTERMRITSSGSVGIGTTTPSGKVEINGAGNQLKLSGGTVAGGIWTNAQDILYIADWQTGGKGLSVNLTSGNVGIGTTSTGSMKLAVDGKVGAREVVVTLASPWPDYVFDDDYKLPSLLEVERYIKANKHLLEVPTAEEVKENGVSLGEMNTILLKKVEELTLYVVELSKANEQNREENRRQQAEIDRLKNSLANKKGSN
jgi:hypothetical protein